MNVKILSIFSITFDHIFDHTFFKSIFYRGDGGKPFALASRYNFDAKC